MTLLLVHIQYTNINFLCVLSNTLIIKKAVITVLKAVSKYMSLFNLCNYVY
jgi:hypothetical protein